MASTQIRQQTPFMVKIFLVMHVIMHFPMNCKLYFQLNQLLVTLSQHRSGESFSTSQNTENLSSSFSSTCAQLPAKLLMWREIPGEGGQSSEFLWGSHRLSLWAHQELSSPFPVGQSSLLPHIPVLLCADSDHIRHEAENIHLLIL